MNGVRALKQMKTIRSPQKLLLITNVFHAMVNQRDAQPLGSFQNLLKSQRRMHTHFRLSPIKYIQL
jgi:hypothetical protein